MTSRSSDLRTAAIVGAFVAAACARTPEPLRPGVLEPGTNFAAHEVHGGLAIDRPRGAIEAAGRHPTPTFDVRVDGGTVATLALVAPAAVEIRSAPGAAAIGTVEPVWDDQAIRFTVHTRDGERFRTGAFRRVGGGAGMSTLTRAARDSLDIRGVFRAELVDDGDRRAGWFQVTAWPPAEPRIFEGVLPDHTVGPAMAVALGSEMDWILDHTLDVYRGGGDRRPNEGGRGR